MALFKCEECSRKISDKATTCLTCGCPTKFASEKSDETQAKILWGIGIAVILIGGTWITIYNVGEVERFKREQA